MRHVLQTGIGGWWFRRLPSLSRIGWNLATFGASRPTAQTAVGIGLIGAGIVLKRTNRRKVLYRGYIEPGSGTHIRVYRGNHAIHEQALGS